MVEQTLPYAQALLEIAEQNGTAQEYAGYLEPVLDAFAQSPQLVQVLGHPGISTEEKTNILHEAFDTEDKLFNNFLEIAARHKMAGRLDQIARDYDKLLDEHNNVVRVQVTSASALDSQQEEKLKKALEKKFQAPVRLYITVDPSLIAGLKIKTENAAVDASWLGRLEKMKEQLAKADTGEV